MVALARDRRIVPALRLTGRYAVNILGEGQQALSDCFAGGPGLGRVKAELNELTVVPHGRSPSQVVTTATPVANRRRTVRSVSASRVATSAV